MDSTYALYGLIAGLGIFVFLFALIILVLRVVAHWKIYEKAGEQGWKSLIPIYSEYTQFKLMWDSQNFLIFICAGIAYTIFSAIRTGVASADGPGFVIGLMGVLSFVAWLVSFVWIVRLQLKTAAAFGKETAFGVGLVLLSFIFECILAFGDARYQGRTSRY